VRGGRDAADLIEVLEADALTVRSAIARPTLAAASVTRRPFRAVLGGGGEREQKAKRRQ
jgi:hypothetical protein